MKKESIRMLHDLLLVRKIPLDKKTKGGIIIPDQMLSESETEFLDVLEVGTKVKGIKAGDRVALFKEIPGGQDFEFNGEQLYIVREKYIFGTVER